MLRDQRKEGQSCACEILSVTRLKWRTGRRVAANPPSEVIESFWAWFESIAAALADDFEQEAIWDRLDEAVSELGEVVWELGPGSKAEYALSLSPDGDLDWLPVTRHIVSCAPRLARWEFNAARPPRPWSPTFTVGDLEVDASSWRYVLLAFPDGIFDLVLEQGNVSDADDSDRYAAAVVLLDGLLGEETRLSRIQDLVVVDELEFEHDAKASKVEHLPFHLQSLLDA